MRGRYQGGIEERDRGRKGAKRPQRADVSGNERREMYNSQAMLRHAQVVYGRTSRGRCCGW